MAARQKAAGGGDAIRFVLDGEVHTVDDVAPTTSVLNFLRERLGRTGTKEGCAEGDCGACTVVLAELDGEGVRFRAVNSCIQFVPTLDGKELITVESLKGNDGSLHPVQKALVDCHGSQCGFCTPGFVMSLFALYKTADSPTRAEIGDALAGNLCRCTGYRPIVDAGVKMYEYGSGQKERPQSWMNCSFSSATDREATQSEREMIERLRAIRRRDTLVVRHGAATFYAPMTLKDLAALREEHPEARMLAGGTDVGLWVTKQHKDLPTVIYAGDVAELRQIRDTGDGLEIGAAATLTDAYDALVRRYPELSELYRRFASLPIRNAGTLGGNIANGSPIGDSMPALIALGTVARPAPGQRTREMPLEEFYSPTRRPRSQPGEFVAADPGSASHFRRALFAPTRSRKRFDQDISAVCACVSASRSKRGHVEHARIAYGGMAATPKRASAAEQALVGREWNETTVRRRDDRARGRLRAAHRHARERRLSQARRRAICCTGSGSKPRAARRGHAGRRVRRLTDRRSRMNRHPRSAAQVAAMPHDSAHLHVSGEALYTDDIPEPRGTLHAAIGVSARGACADPSIDLAAVRAAPGVVAVVHGRGHSRRERLRSDRCTTIRSSRRRSSSTSGSRCSPSLRRTSRQRAAQRGSRVIELRGRCRRDPHDRRRAGARSRSCCRPSACTRGDAAARARGAPHRLRGPRRGSAARTTSTSKARSRCAIPRKTAAMLVLQLDAASGRGAAPGRACARRRTRTTSSSNAGAWAAASAARKRQPALFACVAALLARKTGRAGQAARSTATTT